jgi:hypothetical protein
MYRVCCCDVLCCAHLDSSLELRAACCAHGHVVEVRGGTSLQKVLLDDACTVITESFAIQQCSALASADEKRGLAKYSTQVRELL